MSNHNYLELIGHLTRDPETKNFEGGGSIVQGGIAVSRSYKDRDGDKQEEVSFIDYKFLGKSAAPFAQYHSKGDCVMLIGEVKQERWTTNDDEKRSKVIMNAFKFVFMPRVKGEQEETEKEEVEAPESDMDLGAVPF